MSYLLDDRDTEMKQPADDGAQGPVAPEQDEEESTLGGPPVRQGKHPGADATEEANEDDEDVEESEAGTEEEADTSAETSARATPDQDQLQPRHET